MNRALLDIYFSPVNGNAQDDQEAEQLQGSSSDCSIARSRSRRRCYARAADCCLEADAATSPELHAQVHRDELDLALSLVDPGPGFPDLDAEELWEEEFVAVGAPDGPVGGSSRPLPVKELERCPLIGFYPGSATRTAIDAHLAAAGVRPHVAFESSLVDVSRRLAAAGLGVAILPSSSVEREGPPVVARSLRPRLTRVVRLVWRADRPLSPAARAMREHIRRAVGQR